MNKVPVTVLKQTNANERKQTCSRTPFVNANEHEPLPRVVHGVVGRHAPAGRAAAAVGWWALVRVSYQTWHTAPGGVLRAGR